MGDSSKNDRCATKCENKNFCWFWFLIVYVIAIITAVAVTVVYITFACVKIPWFISSDYKTALIVTSVLLIIGCLLMLIIPPIVCLLRNKECALSAAVLAPLCAIFVLFLVICLITVIIHFGNVRSYYENVLTSDLNKLKTGQIYSSPWMYRFQDELKCCGVKSHDDYRPISKPPSCCNNERNTAIGNAACRGTGAPGQGIIFYFYGGCSAQLSKLTPPFIIITSVGILLMVIYTIIIIVFCLLRRRQNANNVPQEALIQKT